MTRQHIDYTVVEETEMKKEFEYVSEMLKEGASDTFIKKVAKITDERLSEIKAQIQIN